MNVSRLKALEITAKHTSSKQFEKVAQLNNLTDFEKLVLWIEIRKRERECQQEKP